MWRLQYVVDISTKKSGAAYLHTILISECNKKEDESACTCTVCHEYNSHTPTFTVNSNYCIPPVFIPYPLLLQQGEIHFFLPAYLRRYYSVIMHYFKQFTNLSTVSVSLSINMFSKRMVLRCSIFSCFKISCVTFLKLFRKTVMYANDSFLLFKYIVSA
jgi:hypothetical protein